MPKAGIGFGGFFFLPLLDAWAGGREGGGGNPGLLVVTDPQCQAGHEITVERTHPVLVLRGRIYTRLFT